MNAHELVKELRSPSPDEIRERLADVDSGSRRYPLNCERFSHRDGHAGGLPDAPVTNGGIPCLAKLVPG